MDLTVVSEKLFLIRDAYNFDNSPNGLYENKTFAKEWSYEMIYKINCLFYFYLSFNYLNITCFLSLDQESK